MTIGISAVLLVIVLLFRPCFSLHLIQFGSIHMSGSRSTTTSLWCLLTLVSLLCKVSETILHRRHAYYTRCDGLTYATWSMMLFVLQLSALASIWDSLLLRRNIAVGFLYCPHFVFSRFFIAPTKKEQARSFISLKEHMKKIASVLAPLCGTSFIRPVGLQALFFQVLI